MPSPFLAIRPHLFALRGILGACSGLGRQVSDPDRLERLRVACWSDATHVSSTIYRLEDPGRFRILLPVT